MAHSNEKLVIIASRGHDDERATVAWTIANGGLSTGLEVTMFVVSAGLDIIRKGAATHVRMNPFDPSMQELIDSFQERGGKILACPPCAAVRGYSQEDLIDGVEIVGSPAMHALIKDGAATLSF
jgi:predicted peroxiredoxin